MPATVSAPRTLYDKIWDEHVVCVRVLTPEVHQPGSRDSHRHTDGDGPALIYIDR